MTDRPTRASGGTDGLRGSRPGLPLLVRRHRRGLAALLAGLAVLTLGIGLRPPPPAVRAVVVAGRDLPVGHRLALADLATAAVPAGLTVPGTIVEPDEVAGRVLSAPLLRGEAVSTTRLVDAVAPSTAAPPGTVPLPVRFADPAAAALLAAGQRIDVLAARSSGMEDPASPGFTARARVVASGALVLMVSGQPTADRTLLGAPGADQGAALVLLAVTRAEALAVAGAEATGRLAFTLAPPG